MSQENASSGSNTIEEPIVATTESQLAAKHLRESLDKMAAAVGDSNVTNDNGNESEGELDDDFSGDEEDGVMYTGIGLGYAENPEHPLTMRRDYFPSKIGGRPAWLNPRDMPSNSEMTCQHCSKPYRFLMQIYAPISDLDNSFHRTLFVFSCPSGTCVVKNGSVKILRSQLPRKNDFYSFNPPPAPSDASYDPNIPMDLLPEENVNVCAVCALPALKRCSQCKTTNYCSEDHQAFDWKMGHNTLCVPASDLNPEKAIKTKTKLFMTRESALYPCLEIVTEEEALEIDEDSKAHAKQLIQTYENEQTKLTPEQRLKDDKELTDLFGDTSITPAAEVRDAQEPVEVSTTPASPTSPSVENIEAQQKADPTFVAFQTRVSYNPEQVVRYVPRQKRIKAIAKAAEGQLSTSSYPLWISSTKKLNRSAVPPCSHCNGPRDFEFQIMPQILYMIEQAEEERSGEVGAGSYHRWCLTNKKIQADDALDFGTIAVYTCRNSCDGNSSSSVDKKISYVSEYAYIQPPFM